MVEQITKKLEQFFAVTDELNDAFVVEINQSNTKLDVFVDADSGMTFRKCQLISRHLEAWLDEEKPLGEAYTLNVSSPGVDRPLKFRRQYDKNVGRSLDVTTTAGDKLTGELVTVTDQGITLEGKVRIKEGKRKKNVVQQTPVAFEDIKKATVKISFKK